MALKSGSGLIKRFLVHRPEKVTHFGFFCTFFDIKKNVGFSEV